MVLQQKVFDKYTQVYGKSAGKYTKVPPKPAKIYQGTIKISCFLRIQRYSYNMLSVWIA